MKRPDSEETSAFLRLVTVIDFVAFGIIAVCLLWMAFLAVFIAWRAGGWVAGSFILALLAFIVIFFYLWFFRSRLRITTVGQQNEGD